MLRVYPGGGAPGYGTGLQEACSCNGTQKAPVRHPLGADPDGLAAADQRHRLSWWAARGLLPQGLQPSTIAAAYTRATGRPPARDPDRKQSRAYSAWELLQALAQLSPPLQPLGAAAARPAPAAAPPPPPPATPPPRPVDPLAEPLGAIWGRTLQALELPSTRMLLIHQARLLELRQSRYPQAPGEVLALVAVASNWLAIVATRRHLIAQALAEVLGVPVCVALIAAGEGGR
jgi:hypothetical protein